MVVVLVVIHAHLSLVTTKNKVIHNHHSSTINYQVAVALCTLNDSLSCDLGINCESLDAQDMRILVSYLESLYTRTKGHDLEILRVLETHLEIVPWVT